MATRKETTSNPDKIAYKYRQHQKQALFARRRNLLELETMYGVDLFAGLD